jgi:enoyl-CoA hydratase/carnithine racemase
MTFEQIRYDAADGLATITLHRPEKLNAVTTVLIRELLAAFDAADVDDAVRVVIVTGAGRAFCAGADLSGGTETFDGARRGRPAPDGEHRDGGGLVALRIFDLKKPVIAAINGPAVGFGVTMTLPMDIRIASSAARMGFVFARRGVVPEACSTWFLPRLVGMQRAAEWVYTGRVFDAEEARAGGLVSRVVAPEALLPTVRALAREIADNTSAVSVALARQMMWKLLGADHPMEGHRLDSRGMDWTGRSADAREGIASFLEKRPPQFPLTASRDMPPFYPWWTERAFR